MNKTMIIGNVGSDPEMRYTPNGSAVTSFSVATSRRYTTSSGEQKEETDWFRVSAWNKLAETCNQYVVKGMKVYVEGRVSTNAWTDQEGQSRASLEINCNNIEFLSRINSDQNNNDNFQSNNNDSQDIDNPEDLPW
ncbi:MAG: single-stranded DNA-binding protein [SAR202 cluster bacterium]|nr:single-stranded DNA-binding protein [SAR202 cluster bacterium]|tara:strand:+ start:70608 stop:71015 length:408 start_codon:yes stop_codon:yes gene_type:complete